MKKGNKRNRYLTWTAVALLLLVLVHPIFHEYQDPIYSDFFSSFNHIESLRPEDSSINKDDHLYTGDVVISALSGAMLPEAVGVFFHPPDLLSSNFYLDHQDLVLRC
jgi:hypothetical protein